MHRLLLALALLIAAPLRAEETCLAPPYSGDTDLARLIARLDILLADFPALADRLDADGPAICLSDALFAEQGYYAPADDTIRLRAGLTDGLALAILIHELRHVDQVRLGACPAPSLAMDETARATFAMEADASAISLLVAWHARAAGDPAAWEALAAWPNAADIARAFEDAMARTGDPAEATAAAFAQWYADPARREAYYIGACSAYLDQLDDSHRLPGAGAVPALFFDTLCRMPDGGTYACAEPEGALAR